MYFTSSHIFILELVGKSFDTCEGRRLVLSVLRLSGNYVFALMTIDKNLK